MLLDFEVNKKFLFGISVVNMASKWENFTNQHWKFASIWLVAYLQGQALET